MSLYKCVSCNEFIQATKARLLCASCAPPMTLCANCYVVQNYPPQHQDGSSHSLSLYKHSGFLPTPPPPPPRTQSVRYTHRSSPSRRRPVSAAYSEVPPRKPPRPTQPETTREPESNEGVPIIPVSSKPVLQDPQQQGTEQYSQPQHQPTGWTSLFNEDMTPTPCFVRLIEELFHRLDPPRTGFISPEAYSEYLDACGAPPNHNIWKLSRAKTPHHGYDIADRELTDHFTSYCIEFSLRPRTPPATPINSPLNPLSYFPPAQRETMSQFMPPQTAFSLSGNQKPMLSLRGWTDLTVLGVLLNPSAAWGQLNRAMKAYHLPIWAECGDIPRGMLPLAPYQPEVDRVRILLEGAKLNAEREIDAVHARLKIEKQGREHALDLLDDRVWVYR
ncbi:hypothetical protein ARAM_005249 [Aspergillus rambellii]|uniref:EF-hand domain-containing protein n=2 Tax=Aspergillus subgen. Nidulantes TaxID=2720870 RepID=A0A0F8WVQ0_9EURO|nr:hypothetical protein ARAM_005249 [Aspergillus rambellii]